MEIIKINIANKRPTVDGSPVIVCNNKYKIQFAFDEEWGDATEMKARFVWRREGKLLHQDIPITDNAVEIPILTKVHCVHVGVHANELHTTTPAKIECEYSILCHSGETSQGLPPNNTGSDGFSPIAKVTQTSTGATIEITDKKGTTTATITNGKDGKDGKNGVDGKNGKDGYTPQKGVDYFDGEDGKDYVLTEADKEEIASMVDVNANTLIVTANVDGEIASHTSKQIYDWVQAGGNVVFCVEDGYTNLTYSGEGYASFVEVGDDLTLYYHSIDENGLYTYVERYLVDADNVLTQETVQSMIDASIANIPMAEGVEF